MKPAPAAFVLSYETDVNLKQLLPQILSGVFSKNQLFILTFQNKTNMSTFNNRVYGAAIIKSINSNYNADFSGQPRKLPNGTVYATDKALKYSIRNYWKAALNEKVFYFKSLSEEMSPRTLMKLTIFISVNSMEKIKVQHYA